MSFTRVSPMYMLPESCLSSPAITRRVVVFPHPVGPNRVTNWPSSTVKEMLSMARSLPYFFVRPSTRSLAMNSSESIATLLFLPYRPQGKSPDNTSLQYCKDYEWGDPHRNCRCHQGTPQRRGDCKELQ